MWERGNWAAPIAVRPFRIYSTGNGRELRKLRVASKNFGRSVAMRSSEGRTWRVVVGERKLGANCARSVFNAGKLRVVRTSELRFWIGIYTESVSVPRLVPPGPGDHQIPDRTGTPPGHPGWPRAAGSRRPPPAPVSAPPCRGPALALRAGECGDKFEESKLTGCNDRNGAATGYVVSRRRNGGQREEEVYALGPCED
eukprot:752506-Hanusia_phi.AAC.4